MNRYVKITIIHVKKMISDVKIMSIDVKKMRERVKKMRGCKIIDKRGGFELTPPKSHHKKQFS